MYIKPFRELLRKLNKQTVKVSYNIQTDRQTDGQCIDWKLYIGHKNLHQNFSSL